MLWSPWTKLSFHCGPSGCSSQAVHSTSTTLWSMPCSPHQWLLTQNPFPTLCHVEMVNIHCRVCASSIVILLIQTQIIIFMFWCSNSHKLMTFPRNGGVQIIVARNTQTKTRYYGQDGENKQWYCSFPHCWKRQQWRSQGRVVARAQAGQGCMHCRNNLFLKKNFYN